LKIAPDPKDVTVANKAVVNLLAPKITMHTAQVPTANAKALLLTSKSSLPTGPSTVTPSILTLANLPNAKNYPNVTKEPIGNTATLKKFAA
jgi:hypothetical protein